MIPIITKMDLPTANAEEVCDQLLNGFDIDPDHVLYVSSKTGSGIPDIFPAIIDRIHPPLPRSLQPRALAADPNTPSVSASATPASASSSSSQPPTSAVPVPVKTPALRGMLVDAWFDIHRGVICLVQIADGTLKVGDRISSYYMGHSYEVRRLPPRFLLSFPFPFFFRFVLFIYCDRLVRNSVLVDVIHILLFLIGAVWYLLLRFRLWWPLHLLCLMSYTCSWCGAAIGTRSGDSHTEAQAHWHPPLRSGRVRHRQHQNIARDALRRHVLPGVC